jgi:F-type H+-transporting ATPase subunit a
VHRVKIFNLFLTKEIPLFIIPVLICIEAISFLSRIFSLAIRLFANLVAGHILLKILIIFLAKILEIHLSFSFPSIIMFFGILIIITLEVMISILQVYIFNMLLLIYVKNVLKLH